jgi:hypothetical protein
MIIFADDDAALRDEPFSRALPNSLGSNSHH